MSNLSKFIRFYSIPCNKSMRFLGDSVSNSMAFRLARPKIRAAFKPAGPPPIMTQSYIISIRYTTKLNNITSTLVEYATGYE